MTLTLTAHRLVAQGSEVTSANAAAAVTDTSLIAAYTTASGFSGFGGPVRVASHAPGLTLESDEQVGALSYIFQGALVAGTIDGELLVVAEGGDGASAWTASGHAWDSATGLLGGAPLTAWSAAPVDNAGAMWVADRSSFTRVTMAGHGTPLAYPDADPAYVVHPHGSGARGLFNDAVARTTTGAGWATAATLANPWGGDLAQIYAATESLSHYVAAYIETGFVRGPYVVDAASGAATLVDDEFDMQNTYVTSAATPTTDGGMVWATSGLVGGQRVLVLAHLDAAGNVTRTLLPESNAVTAHHRVAVASRGLDVLVVSSGPVGGGVSRVDAWHLRLGDARLKVGVIQGGAMIWRKVGDESWADGPGRMKLGVPRSLSPSGWMMEVKPGDDTTGARTMHLDINGGDEVAAVRFIPAE